MNYDTLLKKKESSSGTKRVKIYCRHTHVYIGLNSETDFLGLLKGFQSRIRK